MISVLCENQSVATNKNRGHINFIVLLYNRNPQCSAPDVLVSECEQAAPLVAGLCVAVTALAGRYGIQAWQAFKARPPTARMRKFYEGGFQQTMTRREAALILGVRYFTIAFHVI